VKTHPRPRKIAFVALGALAIMLAASTPSQAAGGHVVAGGHGVAAVAQHGFEGHHSEGHGFEGHHFEGHGFEGHHFEGHGFEGHHFEGRHFEDHDGRFGFGLVVPYSPPYYAAPSYWYYCPSYGEYYPNVTSCPEAWVPVPAQ